MSICDQLSNMRRLFLVMRIILVKNEKKKIFFTVLFKFKIIFNFQDIIYFCISIVYGFLSNEIFFTTDTRIKYSFKFLILFLLSKVK